MRWLQIRLHVEPGEQMPVLLLFLYLALHFSSFVIIKSARDGIFLQKFSPEMLANLCIATAVVMALAIPLYLRISSRFGLRKLITGTVAFFMANVLLLWWAARSHWGPLPAVYWVWTAIFGVTVPTQAWTVANRVLDVRQAKRLFPLISSGGMIGSVAGGLLAAAGARVVHTQNLLLLPILLLAACGWLARHLLLRYGYAASGIQARTEAAAPSRGIQRIRKTLLSSRYLRMIALMLAISAVVSTLINYQYLSAVKGTGRSGDHLTIFFGNFNAIMNVIALVLQLAAGSHLAERFGVRVTLFMLPATLASGTLLLLGFPMALWPPVALKAGDQTLRYSVDRSTTELLYLPVPRSMKTDAKAVIDMLVLRVAEGLGGVLLLALTTRASVGACNLVLIALWIGAAWITRGEYVCAVKAGIADRSAMPQSALRLVFDDPGSVASIRTMLQSNDEEVVLYAMDLAAGLGQQIPAHLVTHPSPRVRLKATELAGMTVAQLLERVRTDGSSVVAAGALLQASRMRRPNRPDAALQEYLGAPEFKVRLSALACLARQGMAAEAVNRHWRALTAELDETSPYWNDVVQALGEMPQPGPVDLYVRLLEHPAPGVKRQAIPLAGRSGRRELVPPLIRLLGEPEAAGEARRALRQFGARILGSLADVMRDPAENLEVRRNLPRVLAYVPHQETVEILLEGLFDYDAVVADRSLRALSKLRLVDGTLAFDQEKVGARIRHEGEMAQWYGQALDCLYPGEPGADPLPRLLRERMEQATEHVFRLLALILPAATLHASYLALHGGDRARKANVAEYLDNVLPAHLRKCVLPLIERRAGKAPGAPARDEVLQALIRNADAALRECVADAVARNKWGEPKAARVAGN